VSRLVLEAARVKALLSAKMQGPGDECGVIAWNGVRLYFAVRNIELCYRVGLCEVEESGVRTRVID
jgi:hypothetical protein